MSKEIFLNFCSKYLLLTMVASLSFWMTGCSDDDDTGGGGTVVEDGLYVKGAGTGFADFSTKALFKVTKNEVLQEDRANLLELYIPVKAGADGFNIVNVSGTTRTTYGPGADFKKVETAALDVDEPKDGLWKGNLVEAATAFTVPEDGLYHVVVDLGLKKVAIARVNYGLIGGATPGGWSTNTPMTTTFNLTKMEFVASDVLMLKNDWKFRYSNGWKINIDTEFDLGGGKKGIKANSNLGGTIDNLTNGGANISNTVYGLYKFTLTYEVGKGFTATQTKTGDGPPLAEYPEKLYMIGDAVGGWDWATIDLPMVPVHSHPELFWKIVRMEGPGGFNFAQAESGKVTLVSKELPLTVFTVKALTTFLHQPHQVIIW